MQEKDDKRLYSAADIAKLLDVSTNAARDFLDHAAKLKMFPVIKVGVQYRVPADQFDEWNSYAKLQNVCAEGVGGCEKDRTLVNPEESTVYRPSDIQRILKFSKGKTYTFIAQVYAAEGPFMVMKLGKSYRINKASFDYWFNNVYIK